VSWVRRHVGLDGMDLVIQAGVTMFVMIMVAGVGAISMVVLGVRRHLALRRGAAGPMGETTGEVMKDHIAELDARMTEVDALNYRVQELEERVDFAERLLAQSRDEPGRLEAPR
jgi:hypothetical protein